MDACRKGLHKDIYAYKGKKGNQSMKRESIQKEEINALPKKMMKGKSINGEGINSNRELMEDPIHSPSFFSGDTKLWLHESLLLKNKMQLKAGAFWVACKKLI